MYTRIVNLLESIPATVLSAVLLILSLILPAWGILPAENLAWGAVLISGFPLLLRALHSLLLGRGLSRISSELLITCAMTAAVLIGDLFAAGEVAVIMAIGSILEERTVNRARQGVTKLLKLAPTTGRRITPDGEEIIPAEKIRKNDVLRILPGESIPVDGTIIRGETSVDQSIMTGESLPVDKGVGDELYCGTINRFGAVEITATGVGEDSSLKKMVRLVQEAEDKKAPTVRLMDRYASLMVPASLLIAVVTFLITRDLTRAVTVLVVFCPCALTLATPTAIVAGIGQATKQGVIIKSGEALETMGRVDTVTFDKTGTLTRGKLEVSDVFCFDTAVGEDELLSLTASAESKSEHPLGKAVVDCAKERKIARRDCEDFQMTAGRGVCAVVLGRRLFCGNEPYLNEKGITLTPEQEKRVDFYRSEGKAMILVATPEGPLGLVALSDAVRPEAKKMVKELQEMDTRAVLLTGDARSTAEYFAGQVGIGEVHAGLLPGEKADHIEGLKQHGRRVCMIGDGVNDALALKTADVGIAMGTMGSDISIEAADIALMSDDISKLPYLKWLAGETLRTIRLSITAAMTINMIALVLSVLGLLGPTAGALVHNVGSCLVVMFAGLLYDRKYKKPARPQDTSPQEGPAEVQTLYERNVF